MQKFLKAAAVATAMALVATAAFAADAKATVKMNMDVFGTNGFVIQNEDQKDSDMLQFSASNEKAGAEFKLWTDLAGDSSTVHMRSAKIWIKPLDMLQISFGNVGGYGYTEQINWWKVPVGSSIVQVNSWDARWASNSTGENGGVQFDLTPVDGLAVTLGAYPGFGNSFFYTKDDPATAAVDEAKYEYNGTTAYGAQVKYNIAGFGSALVAWKDNGALKAKFARVGFDVNAVPGLYAFVSANMRFERGNEAYGWYHEEYAPGEFKMRGITIDNYFKYSAGDFSVAARFPVTIRTGETFQYDHDGNDATAKVDTVDDSYMTWCVKATYAVGAVTPYLILENDANVLNFSKVADTFMMIVQPGFTYNLDGCNLDLAAKITVPAKGGDVTWAIPLTANFSF